MADPRSDARVGGGLQAGELAFGSHVLVLARNAQQIRRVIYSDAGDEGSGLTFSDLLKVFGFGNCEGCLQGARDGGVVFLRDLHWPDRTANPKFCLVLFSMS